MTRRFVVPLVCVLSLAGASAQAEPNPICEGLCGDAITACGDPADCGGDPCDLPIAECLPPMPPVVRAVLPESVFAFNDYGPGVWSGAPYEPAVGGGMQFEMNSAQLLERYFALPQGRFIVAARVTVGPDNRAWIESGSAAVGETSFIGSSAYYTDVTDEIVPMFIDTNGYEGPFTISFRSSVADPVIVRDIAVYELSEYGVFARFAVAGAPAGTVVRVQDETFAHHSLPQILSACGELHPPPCIDDTMERIVQNDGWTEWFDTGEWASGSDRATHGFVFLDDATGERIDAELDVTIEVAWDPMMAPYETLVATVPPDEALGVVLPDGKPAPYKLALDTQLLLDVFGNDRPLLDEPGARPQQFFTSTITGLFDANVYDFGAPPDHADSFDMIARLGINARTLFSEVPSAADWAAASAAGFPFDLVHGEGLVNETVVIDVPLEDFYPSVQATAATFVVPPDPAPGNGTFVILHDEVRGLAFAGQAYADAFHDWLADRLVEDMLTVADLGYASIDDVPPYTLDEPRPADPIATPELARRWSYALRFWNEYTGRGYGLALAAMTERVGEHPMSINFGTPEGSYLSYAWGTDFQAQMRNGGASALFFEGFHNYADVCLGPEIPYFADYFAAQVRPWPGTPLVMYTHPHKGFEASEVLVHAARGVTHFVSYGYGPYDVFVDGNGGRGEYGSREFLVGSRTSADALVAVEDVLFDARAQRAPIVHVAAQTDPIWSNDGASITEERGWHTLLGHDHWPVDIVVEERLADELDGRSIVHLDRTYVGNAAWAELVQFVEDGGTLVLGPRFADHDEFGQPSAGRSAWHGIAPLAGLQEPETRISAWTIADLEVETGGVWRAFASDGVDVLATWPNGDAAAVAHDVGNGRVIAIGVGLGADYEGALNYCDATWNGPTAHYPAGLPAENRDVVAAIVQQAVNVPTRPVDVDDPLVTARISERGEQRTLLLVDYGPTNEDVGDIEVVTLPGVAALTSELTGTVYAPDVDGRFEIAIDRHDLLSWIEPEAPMPADTSGSGADVSSATGSGEDPAPSDEGSGDDEGSTSSAGAQSSAADGGCGCNDTPAPTSLGAGLLALALVRRRR